VSDTKFFAIVTTIQEPTPCINALAQRVGELGGTVLVMGDRKGPEAFLLVGTEFYSLAKQLELDFELGRMLPVDHYGRKNLGYLQAFSRGAELIYETDDDNAPVTDWQPRDKLVNAAPTEKSEWLNAYRHFSNGLIWPRGFPLDEVSEFSEAPVNDGKASSAYTAPIQQGLANHSPDVDAIWRLILDKPVEFEAKPSIWLAPGSWCPFNSQSTWWWPEAYPLMYLPSYCSFRMTDIWRSFVAQRCLWELGHGLVFHAPEVVQERNEHDLMRDFEDEVDGYLRNKELVKILAELDLEPGSGHQGENLRSCYEALVAREFFPEKELTLVNAWLSDLEKIGIQQ
jgi:hypothetical protein